MRVNPNVVFRVLGDAAVLVDLSTNGIFELNQTGAAIWDRLSRSESTEIIVAALIEEFDVDATTAREHVDDLIAELQKRGLLVP